MQPFRKMLWFIIGTVISFAYAGNALAKDAKMQGVWCSEDEREILYWEKESIGLNEHTVCEFEMPLSTGPHISMTLSCANIYFHGDEIVRAFERAILFEASYVSPNQLRVTIDSNETPILYTRCYE